MSDEKIYNYLSHEVTHLKYNDNALSLILRLIEIINWYNPVVHYLMKTEKTYCELACDERVLCDKEEDFRLIDLDLFKKQEILNELHNSEKVNALKESGISVGIPEAAFSFSCPFITTSKEEKPPFAPRIDAKGNTYLCQIFDGIEYSLGNVNRQSFQIGRPYNKDNSYEIFKKNKVIIRDNTIFFNSVLSN